MLASGVLVYLGADTCRCSEEITVPTYIRVSDYQVFEQQIRLIQIVLGPFNLFIRFLFIYFIGPLASLEALINSALSVRQTSHPAVTVFSGLAHYVFLIFFIKLDFFFQRNLRFTQNGRNRPSLGQKSPLLNFSQNLFTRVQLWILEENSY